MDVNLTAVNASGAATDLRIGGCSGATMGQLAPLVLKAVGAAPGSTISCDGSHLPADLPLTSSAIRPGAFLEVGPRPARSIPIASILQAKVLSGPDAGGALTLNRGTYRIGRSPAADLTVTDDDISREHAALIVDRGRVLLRDLESTNGTRLNGVSVGSTDQNVDVGSLIQLGNSVLRIEATSEPPAMTRWVDGRLLVHRPPPVNDDLDRSPVIFPDDPVPGVRPRVQLLAALLPAVLGVGLALTMHSSEFLAFALLSPMTMVASMASERRTWRRGSRSQRQHHEIAERQALQERDARLAAEAERCHRRFPDAASVQHMVATPDTRLWERRPMDSSFLSVRLGIGDRPAETRSERTGRPLPEQTLLGVPVVVGLDTGAVGIAGPLALATATARWAIAQVLALHSHQDVSVVALLDDNSADWLWLRWVEAGQSTIATSESERIGAMDRLTALLRDRQVSHSGNVGSWTGPWVVVLIAASPGSVADLADLPVLLAEGPAVGIAAICLADHRRSLPPFCRTTVTTSSETGSAISIAGPDGPNPSNVIADRVSYSWAENFARQLAPLRDAQQQAVDRIADEARLSELLDLESMTADGLLDRWDHRSPGAATVIGSAANGPFELDLTRDGPHLLVAGTTGSGKSEFLRSLVTGLAVGHPPDDISFVLVDYKGGAAFAECARLPHTLGLVTDLDAHLTSRALISLDAELRRRERAFSEASVSDLAAYRSTDHAGRAPLSRLVLVIDEFASLAEELPEFLTGLMSIAQRGRSLGVHLVLATQRPAGVVSMDIKANMSLRIALRVTDANESNDVIGDDAASRISKQHPGRAFASIAGSDLVEFQVARVGVSAGSRALTVTPLDAWNRPASTGPADKPASSDLQRLQRAMSVAADLRGQPAPARPWLATLPSLIEVRELDGAPADRSVVAFGRTDDPAGQLQPLAVHDLRRGGSIGIIGGPRSGRTTAARTIIGQSTAQLGPDELHLYVVDCAGQNFLPAKRLPHCGAVADRDEPAAIGRLVTRLVDEMLTRQRQLADMGVGSVVEAAEAGITLPLSLLIVDGWEGLTSYSDEHDGGRTVDAIVQLMRAGSSAGFTVLVTGDRTLLAGRIAPATNRKFVLGLADRADYAMAGLGASSLPVQFRPGQAISPDDGLETQFAVLDRDLTAQAQWTSLLRSARPGDPAGGPAVVIRPLPSTVHLRELGRTDSDLTSTHSCLLGLGGDDAAPVECDLLEPYSRFLIAGPTRSGRSTTALLVAEQAHAAGQRIVIAAPSRSPLTQWGLGRGHPTIAPDPADPQWRAALSRDACDLIVVDDSEQFTDTEAGDALLRMIAEDRTAVVATARSEDLMVSFRGIGTEVRRQRMGLLLQPASIDGDLLGVRLGQLRPSRVPGRGILVTDRYRSLAPDGLPIQVAI